MSRSLHVFHVLLLLKLAVGQPIISSSVAPPSTVTLPFFDALPTDAGQNFEGQNFFGADGNNNVINNDGNNGFMSNNQQGAFFGSDPSSTPSGFFGGNSGSFGATPPTNGGFFGGNGQQQQQQQFSPTQSSVFGNNNFFGNQGSQGTQSQFQSSQQQSQNPQGGQQGLNQGFPVSNAFPSNPLPPIFGRRR